jgi:riboflavin synthase
MFTGIVEELGHIQAIEKHTQGARFWIQAAHVLEGTKIGDSLAMNGCCLTVIHLKENLWACDVVQETLEKTNLLDLQVGDGVNLERAIRLQDRLGGHLVQGHIDGTGHLIEKKTLSDDSWWITIQASPHLLQYLIYKGSIAVDGVSLTVTKVTPHDFSFAMIPHTAHVTNLKTKQVGQRVNLEIDLMAKYVERLLQAHSAGK